MLKHDLLSRTLEAECGVQEGVIAANSWHMEGVQGQDACRIWLVDLLPLT